jgi:hypothetical protein
MQRLKESGIKEGYFILLDGDKMHDHNEEKGYDLVDLYLEASGKAILKATRSGEDRRTDDRASLARRNKDYHEDIVAHRVNDSAGDEFLIYVPLEHSPDNLITAKRIAERVLAKIYMEEENIAKGNQESL